MSFITADADDYFAEIAGTGFDVLYEELNVKKEIVEIDAALAGNLMQKGNLLGFTIHENRL